MDNQRTPLAVIIAPANDHESQHIERLVDALVLEPPRKETPLIYDKPPTATRCVGEWHRAASR